MAVWHGLKVVLVRSCSDLDLMLGPFWVVLYWFLYYFVEIDVFEKKWFQDASWDDLGPIWVAKGLQKGGLLGYKLG